jgi:hypothetical protein
MSDPPAGVPSGGITVFLLQPDPRRTREERRAVVIKADLSIGFIKDLIFGKCRIGNMKK